MFPSRAVMCAVGLLAFQQPSLAGDTPEPSHVVRQIQAMSGYAAEGPSVPEATPDGAPHESDALGRPDEPAPAADGYVDPTIRLLAELESKTFVTPWKEGGADDPRWLTKAGTEYPAKAYMDAYMNAFAARGLTGNQLLCTSAIYTMYSYAENIAGPALGIPNFGAAVLAPFNNGFAFKCPGLGLHSSGSVHFGITNPNPGFNVGEGPGPYVSVRCTSPKNACAGASGSDARATVYYVTTHESGHAYSWHFFRSFIPPGGSNAECFADDFARAVGAKDLFGYCV